MRMTKPAPVRRKATNVSLDAQLVADVKALGINVSRACEEGLAAELKAERSRLWKIENAAAIESANAYVRENGVPLAKYRQF